jgi:plasmid stability protein
MPAVVIRNLPPETHEALKARARAKGRSTEAEIREILKDAVTEPTEMKLGTALRELGRQFDLGDFEIERSKDEPRYPIFE